MRKSEGVSRISENSHLGCCIHLVVRSSLLSALRKRDTKGPPFNTQRRILIHDPRVQTLFTTQVHHETSGYFVPHLIRMKCFKGLPNIINTILSVKYSRLTYSVQTLICTVCMKSTVVSLVFVHFCKKIKGLQILSYIYRMFRIQIVTNRHVIVPIAY